MNMLIIGAGGREHALAWKLAQSPQVKQLFVAPGNAGTQQVDKTRNVDIDPLDIDGLIAFAQAQQIKLTIVGPEAPLGAGIVDRFKEQGLACFGPCQQAARLEGSKAFCKEFLTRHAIPTAAYQVFTEIDAAIAYIQQQGAPIVVKADGLASGKGVMLAQTQEEAIEAVRDSLSRNRFGAAGAQVVIEQFLQGEEASFIVMVDGQHVLPLATSQDHKARDDGDQGPNTGGMGAYSPAPVVTPAVHKRIMQQVIWPTVRGMAAEGVPYTGFLYAGVMISAEGTPYVLEFNCRFGDPETQPIMMRLQSDLAQLCQLAVQGQLDQAQAQWSDQSALGVVMAAGGYPGPYATGLPITGLPIDRPDVTVFHAGTAYNEQQQLCTQGGRVLCVTALGDSLKQAQTTAYQALEGISWRDCFYRQDIGAKGLHRKE